jgi:cytidylate kinase
MGTFLVARVPRSGKSTIAGMIARELSLSYFPVERHRRLR